MTNYQNNNTTQKSERASKIGWLFTNKTPEQLGYIRGFRKVK